MRYGSALQETSEADVAELRVIFFVSGFCVLSSFAGVSGCFSDSFVGIDSLGDSDVSSVTASSSGSSRGAEYQLIQCVTNVASVEVDVFPNESVVVI